MGWFTNTKDKATAEPESITINGIIYLIDGSEPISFERTFVSEEIIGDWVFSAADKYDRFKNELLTGKTGIRVGNTYYMHAGILKIEIV
jgi:hypothetical protein